MSDAGSAQPGMNAKKAIQLLLLGLPVLVLILAGIAITGFLAVDLIGRGVRDRELGPLILGGLLAASWMLMFYKTAQARAKSTRAESAQAS